ncbi:MAG TPA: hypothetical protein DEP38_11580, partial [Cyanobacteria bacterium UBA9226]|nr:hypothetical protein [Cyanobacteria bacterium UBA9226]
TLSTVDPIFVRDLQTNTTRLVSMATDGTVGNNLSFNPSISADGRYVVFSSDASNLVSGDTNNAPDIFVRDLQTNTTRRISLATDGTQGNDYSYNPSISADGRYVAFISWASNLVSGDTNNALDVFVATNGETPGDTLTTALNSGLSSAHPGTFNLNAQIGDNPNVAPGSDVDMIAFQLDAGGRVTIDIDARINTPSSPLDSVLRIFDSNGNQVAVSDDAQAPGEPFTFDSYIDFTATQTGTYYVGVSSYSNFNYNPNVAGSGTGGSTGNYNLQINMFETPGDTLATARQSGLTSANPGTFNLSSQIGNNPNVSRLSDVDMIAFQLDAGGQVTIDIDANQNGSPLDSVLRIFNSSGQEVAFSDDNAAPGEGASLDSYLNFTATQAGTYYVGVSGYCNDDYNPTVAGSGIGQTTGNYNLQMTVLDTPMKGITQFTAVLEMTLFMVVTVMISSMVAVITISSTPMKGITPSMAVLEMTLSMVAMVMM